LYVCVVFGAAWEGVFGMAVTQSVTSVGYVDYTDAMANIYRSYAGGTFIARRASNYFVELCTAAQVTYNYLPAFSVDRLSTNSLSFNSLRF